MEVVTLAFPADRLTVASTVVPAVKATVPVGCTVGDATVAVNVTGWPNLEGFIELVVDTKLPPMLRNVAITSVDPLAKTRSGA